MKNSKDLIEKKFNKLTIKKLVGKDKWGHKLYLCKCDCGNEKIVVINSIKSGLTRSCGCLCFGNTKPKYVKHGYARKKQSKTYRAFIFMKARCNNPKDPGYKNYGERGIKICKRWMDKKNGFINFLHDMGEIPKNKELDHINNNGNYCPKNCKLSTEKEQSRNKRNNDYRIFNKEKRILKDLARKYKINYHTLWSRIYESNMSIKEALTKSVKGKRK